MQFEKRIETHEVEIKSIVNSISELKRDLAVIMHRQDSMRESQKEILSKYEDMSSLYQKINAHLEIANKHPIHAGAYHASESSNAVELLSKLDRSTIILFASLVLIGIAIGQSGLLPDILNILK